MTRARVAHLGGDLDDAERIVLDAIQHAKEDGSQTEENRARAALASLWVEQDNLAPARLWADTLLPDAEHWARFFGATNPRIVLGEVLLASGDTGAALRLISGLIAEGTRRKRWAELVQIHVHEAIGLAQADDLPAAKQAIQKALNLGRQGGFVQPFLVPFFDVSPLLGSLAPPVGQEQYTAQVARAVQQRHGNTSGALLSKRELEILAFIKLGMPNRKIGDRLFISEPTVKRHLANVNTKLGTRNRTEACARVASLGLI